MLVYTILKVLVAAGVASGYALPSEKEASANGYLKVRQSEKAPDSTEIAAHSRRPNVPLPKEISDHAKSILQFMTVWEQAELSTLHDAIDTVSKSATPSSTWTKDQVLRILKVGQAVSTSHMSTSSDVNNH
jgi:hypothetical protein